MEHWSNGVMEKSKIQNSMVSSFASTLQYSNTATLQIGM
jgi:hypothetical protein